MKKLLSIIGCIVVLAATSCTKKYITPNPNATYYADIPASQWTLTTDKQSYVASIDIKDLDPNFAQAGGVIVAISYSGNSSDVVYEQLPEVYQGTSFSYTYNAGNVSIYAQSSDGSQPFLPTSDIKAKIILVASN